MKVSVCTITYNQQAFIGQALESALAQEVDFPFEIVVGDDGSTDGTAQIVAEYGRRYPDHVRPLLRPTNLGAQRNFAATLRECRGEYIALLEGDDYWTSPAKLGRQALFLDRERSAALCFHNAHVIREKEEHPPKLFCPSTQPVRTGLEELLTCNYLPTASVMFRNRGAGEYPEWFDGADFGDWLLYIIVARHGDLFYDERVMSVYRLHAGSRWSGRPRSEQIRRLLSAYPLIDRFLEHRYSPQIGVAAENWERELVSLETPSREVMTASVLEMVRQARLHIAPHPETSAHAVPAPSPTLSQAGDSNDHAGLPLHRCGTEYLDGGSLASLMRLARAMCARKTQGNFVVSGVNGDLSRLRHIAGLESSSPRQVYLLEGKPDDATRNRWGMISLLHLHAFEPDAVAATVEALYDRIVEGGIIVLSGPGVGNAHEELAARMDAFRESRTAFRREPDGVVWTTKPDHFPLAPGYDLSLVEEFAEFDPAAAGIESQMSRNERLQLFSAIRKYAPGDGREARFVEIGSFAGASLVLEYVALKKRFTDVRGFAVDPGGTPQLATVLQMLGGDVIHVRKSSSEARDDIAERCAKEGAAPCFIMIDGDHTYEGVRRDILEYYPLLVSGGLMIFHDFMPELTEETREPILSHHGGTEPGIRRACLEIMEGKYGCEIVDLPLPWPTDPSQTQPHLPIIPGVFSTLRAYRKPSHAVRSRKGR